MNEDANARVPPPRNRSQRKNKQSKAQSNEGQNVNKTADAGQKIETGGKNQGRQLGKKKKAKEKHMKLVKVSRYVQRSVQL